MARAIIGVSHPAVHTEERVVYAGTQGQIIETISKQSPHRGVTILPQAFVIKTVNLRNLSGLVVASEQRYSGRPTNFQREQ